MSYVDGYVIPIAKKNLAAYKKLAQLAGKIWKQYGALEYRECAGDDLLAPMGIPFTKLLKLKKTETVIFAWVVYKSKAHRNSVNKKVMKDPRLSSIPGPMPFDCKKITYGGFKTLVDL